MRCTCPFTYTNRNILNVAVFLKELSDTARLMGPTLYLQLVTPLGSMGNCMNPDNSSRKIQCTSTSLKC